MTETIFYENNIKQLAFKILIREEHVILKEWAKIRWSYTKFQPARSKFQTGLADSFMAKCWLTS